MSLSERIKALRSKKGWTTNHLADVSGVPQPTIWRLEKGLIQNPKTNVLQRLARGLEVSVDSLLRDEGEPAASFDEILQNDPVGQAIFRNYETLKARRREHLKSFVDWLVDDQEKKG